MGSTVRAGLRRLAHYLGVAARWCWEQSQPPWSVSPEGFRRYGRLLGTVPGLPWKAVIKADPCVYCGRPSETVEHVEARSAGGGYGWQNEVGACKACNRAKANTALLLFLRARHHAALASARGQARHPSQPKRPRLTAPPRWVSSPSRRQTRAFQSGGHR